MRLPLRRRNAEIYEGGTVSQFERGSLLLCPPETTNAFFLCSQTPPTPRVDFLSDLICYVTNVKSLKTKKQNSKSYTKYVKTVQVRGPA